jgi:hypothetical protein
MSNLLKDASILLTPTGYDNGRMLAVKPEIAFGEELVVNGANFQNTNNWQILNNSASLAVVDNLLQLTDISGGFGYVYTSFFTEIGKKYFVSIDIVNNNNTANTNYIRCGGSANATNLFNQSYVNEYGTKTFSFIATTVTTFITLISGAGVGKFGNWNNISVKEDLSGDFTFSRNSAATRVNAQGLVENVQILSSNLVSNGNFSQIGTEEVLNGNFSQEGSEQISNGSFDTDSNWTKGTGFSINSGSANCDGTQTANTFLKQQGGILGSTINFVVGKTYKVNFDIVVTSGNITNIEVASGYDVDNVTTSGNHTTYITAVSTNNRFTITANPDFVGSIDNVSVKEVGQDWTLGTGWSIGKDKAINDGTINQSLLQTNVFTIGKFYKINFTISDVVGSLDARIWMATGGAKIEANANGNYTTYWEADGTDLYTTTLSTNTATYSITNISVKEVGQNWTLGTGWSIGENKATFDETIGGASNINQNIILAAGKKYKLTFDTLETNGGNVAYRLSGGYTFINAIQANTTHTVYGVGAGTQFAFRGADNFIGSVTNMSVIEITDDTNLPRINYEGFSYQDSLGSELITTLDFNSGWSVVNVTVDDVDSFTSTVSFGYIRLNNILTVGKTYVLKIQGTTTSIGNTAFNIRRYNGASYYKTGITGTFNETFTFTALDEGIFLSNEGLATTDITSISVKEYLGQEVVPNSGCGSWLLEPQSTNLVTESEIYTGYFNNSGTLIYNSVVSPDGSINGAKNYASTTGSFKGLSKNLSSTLNNSAYTLSIFAKAGEFDNLFFYNVGAPAGNGGIWFNLSTGGVGTTQASWSNAKMEDYGNGWYRCSSTITLSGTSDNLYILLADADNSVVATANGTDGYYIFGAQLEALPYATSYIPTNGATSTRLQDIATNSGNASLINSTEGVLYAEVDFSPQDNRTVLIKSNTSDRVQIVSRPNSGIRFFISDSGGLKYNGYSNALVDGFNKIALSWDVDGFYGFVNGSKIHNISTAINLQGLNQASFESGLDDFYGKNKALAVYKTALTDANLRCLTYPNPVATTFDLDFDTIAEQFTFTRESEATFVNAQGLIQSTNELGSELVTNGDFSNGNTGWNLGTNFSVADGKLKSINTTNAALTIQSAFVFTIGKSYKLTFEISDYVEGSVRIWFGGFNAGNFNSNGTFSVIGVANRVDEILIQSIGSNNTYSIDNISVKEHITATNTPRLDYSTGSEAFLLEPQSTNLISYSEDFSNAAWVKLGAGTGSTAIVTSDYAISPDGTQNASRLQCDLNGGLTSSGNQSLIYDTLSGIGDTSGFIYVKSNTNSSQTFYLANSLNDYVNGVATTDWQRIEINWNAAGNGRTFAIGTRGTSNSDDSLDLLIWGAQVESGNATSYIPTSGASATRNQELCVDATPVINSEEGTLYAEISALDLFHGYISISDGTYGNSIRIGFVSDTLIKVWVYVGNSQVISQLFTYDTSNMNKIAVKYSLTDFKVYINGSNVFSTSSITFPIGTLNKLAFRRGDQYSPFFGNTKDLKYYPKALADVQLEDLTSWSSFTEMANALNYTIK